MNFSGSTNETQFYLLTVESGSTKGVESIHTVQSGNSVLSHWKSKSIYKNTECKVYGQSLFTKGTECCTLWTKPVHKIQSVDSVNKIYLQRANSVSKANLQKCRV